jgi:hypothetical protein
MNNNLSELFELGGKKNYEFHYKINKESDNILTIDNDNKIIDVTIGDPDSKDLPLIIKDIINQLK